MLSFMGITCKTTKGTHIDKKKLTGEIDKADCNKTRFNLFASVCLAKLEPAHHLCGI